MTSGGAEALKAAIRRSLPLIVGLIVLGIVAVNVFEQLRGPRYEAQSRILISTTPLSSIITGTQPGFIDPQRVQQTALGIAGSPHLYALAARKTNGRFGQRDALQSATSVSGDPNSDLITFSASSSDPKTAIDIVNAVASAYIAFRGHLSNAQIDNAIQGLEAQISTLPPDSPEIAKLQSKLNRVKVLQGNSSDAELVQRASTAGKTSPAPLRDSLLGFAIGLVVALLVVALREAIDTRIRSEADVEDLLAAPVLASVRTAAPAHADGHLRSPRGSVRRRLRAARRPAHARPVGGDGVVVAVTSAVSREGKTTTAANLGVAAARRGANVLVADLDFRKPALSEVFELPGRARGALQVMSGSAPLESVLWSVSLEGQRPSASRNGAAPTRPASGEAGGNGQEQPLGSLFVLPSGGVIPSRKVPQQSRLSNLVRDMRARASLVILDTPPALLTVEVAELSQLIDQVLVVVRQGRVSQRNLRALRRQARTWPAELAGAVMTDVRAEREYSYYQGS